tara:strand:+ start:4984 stop:7227 length:2244 start_codon:yes stop_codon:yes gene_type:complete
MTDSWKPSLGIETSKTNYLQTEVDLTEATNKQIDENIKMMNSHFDSLIKMHNDSAKARSQNWKELAAFTKDGMKIAKWARDRADAKAAIDNYYNPDKFQHRFKQEQQTSEVEAELDDQKRINYTAAGEIEAIDPDLADMLKSTDFNRAQEKEIYALTLGQSGEWFERAKDTLQVEVSPGVWKTWNEPGGLTALERSIISKEIDEVFITQLQNKGLNQRLMDKYLLHPMLKQHEGRLVKAQAESIKGEQARQVGIRQKQFYDSFNTEGGVAIEKYLQVFNGYHAASSGLSDKGYFLAKEELKGFILSGLENGQIDPDDAERALGYELSPNDGGKPRSVEEYLPQFARPIRKAINQARNDKAEQAELELKNRQQDFIAPILAEWRERDEPPTEEEIHEANQKYRVEFGENNRDLLNYWSKSDIADNDIEFELNQRWVNGEEIRAEDLDGISDAEIKAKWMGRVNSGGLTQEDVKERNADITAAVNEKTFEDDLDKAKTIKWRTIYKNATNRYNTIYRKERSQGQSHEDAKSIALQETEKYILTDESAVRSVVTRNESRADNINSARAAIIKDNSVIDSPDLWKGEEAELKAALRYINTGKGSIPEYYRSFPFINLTPYELMQRRLAATGMIKPNEVETIPERELQPEQQDLLLNKPSPARTNRALLSLEDKVLLVELAGARSEEELLEILRSNSQRNNQLSGYEISQVNIDPALEEEHTLVVGEQPPFMRLNTMLPGVATAYVEDTYNV